MVRYYYLLSVLYFLTDRGSYTTSIEMLNCHLNRGGGLLEVAPEGVFDGVGSYYRDAFA